MKINKILLALVALLGVEMLNADKVCVVTKGGLFGIGTAPALFAKNKKGRLVPVKKLAAKVKSGAEKPYRDDSGNFYAANEVGFIQFKQSQMICNIKYAQNPLIQAVASFKALDATAQSSVAKYLKNLPQLKVAGTKVTEIPAEEEATGEEEEYIEEIEEEA